MNIHILGIAGTMTAPLAQALIKQGYVVTGSDQEKIYPPISQLITNIPLNRPLENIDLVIVGSSYKSFQICRQEFDQIKKLGIPYISATEYVAQNLIKSESILVAGSYGKTTISALLAWILPDSSYFFGGIAVNNFPSLNFSDSQMSIVEADESINGLDTQAKFLYYPVKYLILTSALWEHKESYKTAQDNFNSFKRLVQKLPKDGILIYNPHDPEIAKLLPFCQAKTIPYQVHQFTTPLIGQHNQDNINAALTLLNQLGINTNKVASFPGIKRRLEIISDHNSRLIIDDFAQSASRIKSALKAISYSYPHRRIIVYFEPHASFLQNQESVTEFSQLIGLFDEFVLGKIKFAPDKKHRVEFRDWQHIIHNIHYFPINSDLIKHLKSILDSGDILVHFSSGGLDGLNNLKKFIIN